MPEAEWSNEVEAALRYESVLVPALFGEWAPRVLDAGDVSSGACLLDVACGTGIVARHALDLVGELGRVVGVDSGAAMLSVARDIEPRVRWHAAAAEALPFADGAFDVVTCQSGLMFFSDPEAATREMRRVMDPGGRVVIQTWAPCEAQERFAVLMERHAGKKAADRYRTPWSLEDPDLVLSLVRSGGFPDAELETVDGKARYESVAEFLIGATGILVPAGVNTADLAADVEAALEDWITADGSLVFPEPAHIVTATKG